MPPKKRVRQPEPAPMRTSRRAPIGALFKPGRRVRVDEDFNDWRYAGRLGVVAEVHDVPEPPVYPRGRVGVKLELDRLNEKLFGCAPPRVVWFKPNYLERL